MVNVSKFEIISTKCKLNLQFKDLENAQKYAWELIDLAESNEQLVEVQSLGDMVRELVEYYEELERKLAESDNYRLKFINFSSLFDFCQFDESQMLFIKTTSNWDSYWHSDILFKMHYEFTFHVKEFGGASGLVFGIIKHDHSKDAVNKEYMYGDQYWNNNVVGIRDGSGYLHKYNVKMVENAQHIKKNDLVRITVDMRKMAAKFYLNNKLYATGSLKDFKTNKLRVAIYNFYSGTKIKYELLKINDKIIKPGKHIYKIPNLKSKIVFKGHNGNHFAENDLYYKICDDTNNYVYFLSEKTFNFNKKTELKVEVDSYNLTSAKIFGICTPEFDNANDFNDPNKTVAIYGNNCRSKELTNFSDHYFLVGKYELKITVKNSEIFFYIKDKLIACGKLHTRFHNFKFIFLQKYDNMKVQVIN